MVLTAKSRLKLQKSFGDLVRGVSLRIQCSVCYLRFAVRATHEEYMMVSIVVQNAVGINAVV